MSELSFLIELLLNHKLPKATKDAIAARIKEVEALPHTRVQDRWQPQSSAQALQQAAQAPSTLALMAKHGVPNPTPLNDPASVENIAQTAATAQALQQANMIKGGIKPPTTAEGRPRKW